VNRRMPVVTERQVVEFDDSRHLVAQKMVIHKRSRAPAAQSRRESPLALSAGLGRAVFPVFTWRVEGGMDANRLAA
jgi:hypothetical protein